jgi:hypothetical protein
LTDGCLAVQTRKAVGLGFTMDVEGGAAW